MTTTTSAVRAACDAARPASPCRWPDCHCARLDLRKMLDALLANARAEAAAGERARWTACALKSSRPGHEGEHAGWSITDLNKLRIAAENEAAIRARAAKEASGG